MRRESSLVATEGSVPEGEVNATGADQPSARVRRAIQSQYVDRLIIAAGFLTPFASWIRTSRQRQRLADVEVPNGILWTLIMSRWVGLRRQDRAVAELGSIMDELGTLVGNRMRQGDERSRQLLDLQASLERLTRWLVRLTVVLGVIGLAGIGVAVWAAVR